MFTGIIEAIGTVDRIVEGKKQTLFVIQAPFKKLKLGSSLAVNGVCLTVIGQEKNFYSFNLLNETKKKTNLSRLKKGSRVNLERPLKIGSRVEGHLVQGHVEGVGQIQKIIHRGNEKSFLIAYPKKLKRFFIEKASVAVDGISLTLGKVNPSTFLVHCVPHTLRSTVAHTYKAGSFVNIEADLLSKYLVD